MGLFIPPTLEEKERSSLLLATDHAGSVLRPERGVLTLFWDVVQMPRRLSYPQILRNSRSARVQAPRSAP